MKCSLDISNFLELLIFPILFFSSISLHWSLRKALSLLVILWNSEFKWVYLSFSPLPLASHLFSAIRKASSDNHFAFLNVFFLGMVLISTSYTMLWNSVHSSSGNHSFTCSCWMFPAQLIEETIFSPLYIILFFVIDKATMSMVTQYGPYWVWPCTSEQDPVSPSVSLSHQEASVSPLSLSIREWKPQSQKTNQTDRMDHSLV